MAELAQRRRLGVVITTNYSLYGLGPVLAELPPELLDQVIILDSSEHLGIADQVLAAGEDPQIPETVRAKAIFPLKGSELTFGRPENVAQIYQFHTLDPEQKRIFFQQLAKHLKQHCDMVIVDALSATAVGSDEAAPSVVKALDEQHIPRLGWYDSPLFFPALEWRVNQHPVLFMQNSAARLYRRYIEREGNFTSASLHQIPDLNLLAFQREYKIADSDTERLDQVGERHGIQSNPSVLFAINYYSHYFDDRNLADLKFLVDQTIRRDPSLRIVIAAHPRQKMDDEIIQGMQRWIAQDPRRESVKIVTRDILTRAQLLAVINPYNVVCCGGYYSSLAQRCQQFSIPVFYFDSDQESRQRQAESLGLRVPILNRDAFEPFLNHSLDELMTTRNASEFPPQDSFKDAATLICAVVQTRNLAVSARALRKQSVFSPEASASGAAAGGAPEPASTVSTNSAN